MEFKFRAASQLMCNVAIFTCVASWSGQTQHQKVAEELVLHVHKQIDSSRTLRGSTVYKADVSNEGTTTRTLEAIQMPGGAVGSGRFFHCGLEAWNPTTNSWTMLREEKRTQYGNNPIVRVSLTPRSQMHVCSWMLPAQAGHNGQCVRMTLELSWTRTGASSLASQPFPIGGSLATMTRSGPCSKH